MNGPDRQDGRTAFDLPKYLVIGVTCFAQTFPLSLNDKVIATVARVNEVPLDRLWMLSLFWIPYWAKLLWAPFIDRAGSNRWGRRKTVIVPATLLAAALLLAVGQVEPTPAHFALAVGILFTHALVMSTQDIAVDAYVIEALKPDERATGTAFKTVFETGGTLLAATSILFVFDRHGWSWAMAWAALTLILFTVPVVLRREQALIRPEGADRPTLRRFFTRPDLRLIAPLLLLGGAMYVGLGVVGAAFLVDQGFTAVEVGLLIGTVYASAELAGALGTSFLVARFGTRRTIRIAALLTIPAFVPLLILAGGPDAAFTAAAIAVFCPVILLAMMHTLITIERLGWSAGPQAGTDFTAFGAFYNIGRTLGTAAAAALFATVGGQAYFLLFALALALAFLAFAWVERRLRG